MPCIAVDYKLGDYTCHRIKQALLRGKDSLYKHKYLEDCNGKQSSYLHSILSRPAVEQKFHCNVCVWMSL